MIKMASFTLKWAPFKVPLFSTLLYILSYLTYKFNTATKGRYSVTILSVAVSKVMNKSSADYLQKL